MKPWKEVEADPQFQSLAPDEQLAAQLQYFDEIVAPKVPNQDIGSVRNQFLTDFGRGPGMASAAATQAGQSYANTFLAQPIKGLGALGSVLPGAEEAGQAVTGFGTDLERGIQSDLPVSQQMGKRFPVKAAGAVGQAAGYMAQLATGGALGPSARALQAGGLGLAGLSGAAQGYDLANDYGVTDPGNRAALILGAGGIEAATEAIGGVGSHEFSKTLLGQMRSALRPVGVGKQFLKTSGVEGLEEIIAGEGQDWLTKAVVGEDPKNPGFALNGQPMPAPFWSIQHAKNRLEEGALGSIGGAVFGGIEAARARTPINDGIALRLEARAAMQELEAKQDRTPQEEANLADLRQEDQNLARWLESQGEAKIRPALERMIADPTEAAERMAEAREGREAKTPADSEAISLDPADLERARKARGETVEQVPTTQATTPTGNAPSQVTRTGKTVDPNLTNTSAPVEVMMSPKDGLKLKPGYAHRFVSPQEVVHLADEGVLLTNPELAGKKKRSRGQTTQKMFESPNEQKPNAAYSTNQTVIRTPLETFPEAKEGYKGVAIPSNQIEVMTFRDGEWKSETPEQYAERMRSEGKVAVATPQETPKKPAQNSAAFWRSKEGRETISRDAAEYLRLLDNVRAVENSPTSTPEQVAAARQEAGNHPMARINPLHQSAQESAISKTWDERLEDLKKRVPVTPTNPIEQIKQDIAPLAKSVAEEIQDIDPALAAAVANVGTSPPTTTQNATTEEAVNGSVQGQSQGGVESGTPETSGVSNRVLSPTESQEVTPPQDEKSNQAIPDNGQAETNATAPETTASSKSEVTHEEAQEIAQQFPEIGANVRVSTYDELANDPAFKAFWMGNSRSEEDWQNFVNGDLKIAEGLANDGTGNAVIIPSQVVVRQIDNDRAKQLGISPTQAAALRVMLHENWHGVESWLQNSNDPEVAQLRSRYDALMGEISEGELDSLASRRYPEMSKWRDDATAKRALQSEVMAERREHARITGQPDSLVQRFMQWLHDVWVKISGNKAELSEQELEDLFQAWKRSMETVQPSTEVKASKPERTAEQRLQDIAAYFDYAAKNTQAEGLDPSKATEDERTFAATGLPVEMYRRGTTVAGQVAMARDAVTELSKLSLDGPSRTLGRSIVEYLGGKEIYGLKFNPILASRMATYLSGAVQDRAQLRIDMQELEIARQTVASQAGAVLQSMVGVYDPLRAMADKARELSVKAETEAGVEPRLVSDQINAPITEAQKQATDLLDVPSRLPILEAAQNEADSYPLSMEYLGQEQAALIRGLEEELAALENDLALLKQMEGGAGQVAASKPEVSSPVTIEELRKRIEERRKKIAGLVQKIDIAVADADPVESGKKTVKKAKKKAAESSAKDTLDNSTFYDWVAGAASADIGTFEEELKKYVDANGFNKDAFQALLTNKFQNADPTFIMGVVNRVAGLFDGNATDEGIEEDLKKNAPNYDARAKRVIAKSLGNKVDVATVDPMTALVKQRMQGKITADAFQKDITALGVTPDTSFAMSQKVDEDIARIAAARVEKTTKTEAEQSERQAKAEIDRMAKSLEGIEGKKADVPAFTKLVTDFKKFSINETKLREGLASLNVKPATAENLIRILNMNRARQVNHTWNTIRQNAQKAREAAVARVVNGLKPKIQQPKEKVGKFARSLLAASANGILDSAEVRAAFAEAWGLHGLTEQRLKELGGLLERINGMQEGMPKETFMLEFSRLLNEIAPTSSFSNYGHTALMGYVLSGVSTFVMQATGLNRYLNPFSGTVEFLWARPGTTLQKIGRTINPFNLARVYFDGIVQAWENAPLVQVGASGVKSSAGFGVAATPSNIAAVRPHEMSMAYTPWGQISQYRFNTPKLLKVMGLDRAVQLTRFPAWMVSRSFQMIRGAEGWIGGADKNMQFKGIAVDELMRQGKSYDEAWNMVQQSLGPSNRQIWDDAGKQADEEIKRKEVSSFARKQRQTEIAQDVLDKQWKLDLKNRHREQSALANFKPEPLTPLGAWAYKPIAGYLNSDKFGAKYFKFSFLFARFFVNNLESSFFRTPIAGLTALGIKDVQGRTLTEREQRILQIYGSMEAYRSSRIAKSVSGTAFSLTLGGLMAAALQGWDDDDDEAPAFWVTGDPVGEFGKKGVMEGTGWWRPNTLYIGGKPIINYVNSSPEMASMMALVGNIGDRFLFSKLLSYKENPATGDYELDPFQAYVAPVRDAAIAPLSRSTYRQFFDAAEAAINGDPKKIVKIFANPASGTVAALTVGAIPTVKTVERLEKLGEQPTSPQNWRQAIAASVPFARTLGLDTGKPLTTPFGIPVSQYPFLSLFSTAQEVTPETAKAARLLIDIGVARMGPQELYAGNDVSEVMHDGKRYLLKNEQRAQVLRDIGKRFAELLNQNAKELRNIEAKDGKGAASSKVSSLAKQARSDVLFRFTPEPEKK